jgi:hypothetical protein
MKSQSGDLVKILLLFLTNKERIACDSKDADEYIAQTCKELRKKLPMDERNFSFKGNGKTLLVSWTPCNFYFFLIKVELDNLEWYMVVVVPRDDWFGKVDRSNYIVWGFAWDF